MKMVMLHTCRGAERGSMLIEAVVAGALCLGVVAGIVGAFSITLRSALANTSKVQAIFLETEGLEAVRLMRDNGWTSTIVPRGTSPFYLTFDGTMWLATTTNVYIDHAFERSLTLSDVYRDSSKNIITSGGSLDSNTKKVTVTVSWHVRGATTSQSLSTYITNIFNN